MTSTEVLQRAVQLLGSNQSVHDVKDQVSAEPSANLASISIAATTGDPGSAVALANAVGTAYEQVTAERATADANRTIASLEQLRERYQADLDATPKSPDGLLTSRQQQLVGQIANIAAARAGHHHPGGAVRLRGPVLRTGGATDHAHRSRGPSWPWRWAGCWA